MALTATIFKADLQIADVDRGYYGGYALTIARHPSETDERMMVRLLAFALNASEHLQFTKGLCVDDEPDIWQKSLADEIEVWIDVGLPDEKRVRKACNQARAVTVYAYGARTAPLWWERTVNKVSRFANLQVYHLPGAATQALTELARRTMRLQCTVQDGQAWLTDGQASVAVEPERWYP